MMSSLAQLVVLAVLSRPYGNTMGDGLELTTEPAPPLPSVTCADGETTFGIDVSYYQGTIDWDAVAADGVKFAFIRVSHSLQFFDPEFENNWAGARAAGLHAGVYQYFEPDEDPIQQAQLLLDNMGPLGPGDLPPVIDVESQAGQSQAAIAAAVGEWIDHVESELGVTPIIYTGKYFWQDNVGTDEFADVPLWAAHYTDGCPNIADQWADWVFWQYTSSGSVAGIAGNVDLNDFNGSLEDLATFANGTYVPCGIISPDGDTIDEGSSCFELRGPPEYWRSEAEGEGGSLRWTVTTDFPEPSNYAVWRMYFAEAGDYQVEVHIPAPWGESQLATYIVDHAGGEEFVPVDQSSQDGWVDLGTFTFDAETDHSVRVNDNTGESTKLEIQLVVDALRVTPVDGDGGSTSGDPPGTTGEPDSQTSGAPPTTGPDSDDTLGAGETGASDSDALPAVSEDAPGCGCRSAGTDGPAGLLGLFLLGLLRLRIGVGVSREGRAASAR